MTKLTVFHAQGFANSKVPLSPFDDKTFVFETYDVNTNLDMYRVMVKHFVLNIPLSKLEQPVRTFRRKANIGQFYGDTANYIVLDIDEVTSKESKHKILDFFREYRCILGESKSYNGINNFNLKGLLFTEDIDLNDLKLAVSQIHHSLKDYCVIDESVARRVSFNAPILRNNVFFNNETGNLFKFDKQTAQEQIHAVQKQYHGDTVEFDLSNMEDLNADTIEKLCIKVFQSMGFSAMTINSNQSISFKHPDEKKSPGGYFWFSTSPYTMHHGNSTKTINIFDSVRKLPQAQELLRQDINYDNEFQQFNTDTSVITVNEKFLTVTDEIHDAVNKFILDDNGLFSIRSPMGTGKSTIINHIIEEAHEQDMRILIITNRISVAKDFGKKYDIKVYNQDKYEIGDSLICQFDSLWKYNVKLFDIVIMDEFISLMGHSRNNLSNAGMNIAKFFGTFNKKLVIADAFLTGFENFLLSDKTANVHMVDNTYRDPTSLYSYDDYNYFVNSLVYHADKHKITVSATSLSFINSLQALLVKRGKKVVALTADTPDSTKELIYGLFEEENHDKWDVLIFSPTLTVGVSNLNDVPYHFHFDGSRSTDVISSIQMIKRTRRTKEIHIHVKEHIKYLKTSYNDIRDDYMVNMGKLTDQNYLFAVDDYGETKLSEIGKKAIKIDTFKNILEFNHKEGMLWLLKYHFMKDPVIVDKTFTGDILNRYKKEISANKHMVLTANVRQFLSLSNVEQAVDIQNADKTMRTLAEINSCLILDCPDNIKQEIMELAMTDSQFIKKCKYYKVTFNFTKNIWGDTDVRNLVSKSVTSRDNSDLQFWNALLKYGQVPIFDEYLPKSVNANKSLRYILDKCGYRITRRKDAKVVGHRGYCADENVKRFYTFVNT